MQPDTRNCWQTDTDGRQGGRREIEVTYLGWLYAQCQQVPSAREGDDDEHMRLFQRRAEHDGVKESMSSSSSSAGQGHVECGTAGYLAKDCRIDFSALVTERL